MARTEAITEAIITNLLGRISKEVLLPSPNGRAWWRQRFLNKAQQTRKELNQGERPDPTVIKKAA